MGSVQCLGVGVGVCVYFSFFCFVDDSYFFYVLFSE